MPKNLMLGHDHLDTMVKQARSQGWRPTIKVIIHDGRGNFLSFTSVKYPKKLNFPGGGIDPGESAREGLLRELNEELSTQLWYQPCTFVENPLLATAVTDTAKEGWIKKAQWLFGFRTTRDLRDVEPAEGELLEPVVHSSLACFISRLNKCQDTGPATRKMYLSAVSKLCCMWE